MGKGEKKAPQRGCAVLSTLRRHRVANPRNGAWGAPDITAIFRATMKGIIVSLR